MVKRETNRMGKKHKRSTIKNKLNKIHKTRKGGGIFEDVLINENTQLLHATKAENLLSILTNGSLLSSKEREEQGILAQGEGTLKRIRCHPYHVDIPQKCSETYGVYMRLFMYGDKFFNTNVFPFKKENNYCGLVFSSECLNGTLWHINTCENNGFIIMNGNAEYGGCDEDLSYTIAPPQVIDILPESIKSQIQSPSILTKEFYDKVKRTTEVIVLESIDIKKYLKKIYFMNPEHMEQFKSKLDEMGIEYELTPK